MTERDGASRSLALYSVCLGVLMVVLDTTIVSVALPSIVDDLKLYGSAMTWTVTAYLVPYGGLMILAGRLGDLYGVRRVFLGGLLIFTLGSLICGSAPNAVALVSGRVVQGVGASTVTSVSVSLITRLFSDTNQRAKAFGVYGLVCAAGGGVGEVLGGVLTRTFGWHSIFLLNLPIGVAVAAMCSRFVPADPSNNVPRKLDRAGALVATVALTLLVCALSRGNEAGWLTAPTFIQLASAVVLFGLFLWIEKGAREPLMPLDIFRHPGFATANVLLAVWAAAEFPWLILCSVYLQRILDYSPVEVGLAFVPATLLTAVVSAAASEKMIVRFGLRAPLNVGFGMLTVGLVLFALASTGRSYLNDVLPGMLALGLGSGIVSAPILLVAMQQVPREQSGVASGITNSTLIVGGAVGVAILGSLAEWRAGQLEGTGIAPVLALQDGIRWSFWVAAGVTGVATVRNVIATIWKGCSRLVRPAGIESPLMRDHGR